MLFCVLPAFHPSFSFSTTYRCFSLDVLSWLWSLWFSSSLEPAKLWADFISTSKSESISSCSFLPKRTTGINYSRAPGSLGRTTHQGRNGKISAINARMHLHNNYITEFTSCNSYVIFYMLHQGKTFWLRMFFSYLYHLNHLLYCIYIHFFLLYHYYHVFIPLVSFLFLCFYLVFSLFS